MRQLVLGLLAAGLLAGCGQVSVEPGVSQGLARERAERISDIRYELAFRIPEDKAEPLEGTESLTFRLQGRGPVQLDFREGADHLRQLSVNGNPQKIDYRNEHIVLQGLRQGENRIDIHFIPGDQALNRNDGYLYTLLVPALARTVFPAFDQPNLKAVFSLRLDIPENWVAVSDGSLLSETVAEGRKQLVFNDTKPIPTYLFSFVAGQWEMAEETIDGFPMHFYYRETDPDKLAQIPEVFRQAAAAVRWMEDYTGIPFPFEKYDFIAIPGYQFGGMEHPGAIQFTDKRIFLNPDPTVDNLLSRAELIAHETAHMWFGDLVTMAWFDDVWTKEVFANWFAAQVTGPLFPEVDAPLSNFKRFNLTAYEEDRTAGSNPIKQVLPNLSDAGLIYGNIVYDKAPVVMDMLAKRMGPEAFRAGLQEYVRAFSYGNADWSDLIAILDRRTDEDLAAWSRSWVSEKGMPVYAVDADGVLRQRDPWGRGLEWPQEVDVTRIGDVTLLNASGQGYGFFVHDSLSLDYLMDHFGSSEKPLERISALANLYENYLDGRVPAPRFARFLAGYIPAEKEELLVSTALGYLGGMAINGPLAGTSEMEDIFVRLARDKALGKTQSSAFRTLAGFQHGQAVTEALYEVWKNQTPWPGVTLSETDYTTLALELAVRLPDRAQDILDTQRGRIGHADRLREFDFVRPSVSPDRAVRDSVFQALLQPENRRHEPWVQTTLRFLNHPLRQEEALGYIRPALDALQDVQRTGDIFFPKQWVAATLRGHNSPEADSIVEQFLKERPDYPELLKNKVLQASAHGRRYDVSTD
ncbi:MAG: ERAP1-like C-terminal domain-containing protein [Bacteroidales bacterium]|nr:ERAP1-like C-terminal domain-containing protein [Bacteroidales bacterium]